MQMTFSYMLLVMLMIPLLLLLACLLACIAAIDSWIGSIRLKTNSDKTQLFWFDTRQQLARLDIQRLHLYDGTAIMQASLANTLCVTIDSELTMNPHVNNLVRTCFH